MPSQDGGCSVQRQGPCTGVSPGCPGHMAGLKKHPCSLQACGTGTHHPTCCITFCCSCAGLKLHPSLPDWPAKGSWRDSFPQCLCGVVKREGDPFPGLEGKWVVNPRTQPCNMRSRRTPRLRTFSYLSISRILSPSQYPSPSVPLSCSPSLFSSAALFWSHPNFSLSLCQALILCFFTLLLGSSSRFFPPHQSFSIPISLSLSPLPPPLLVPISFPLSHFLSHDPSSSPGPSLPPQVPASSLRLYFPLLCPSPDHPLPRSAALALSLWSAPRRAVLPWARVSPSLPLNLRAFAFAFPFPQAGATASPAALAATTLMRTATPTSACPRS